MFPQEKVFWNSHKRSAYPAVVEDLQLNSGNESSKCLMNTVL